jgi:glycosyl transferase family 2
VAQRTADATHPLVSAIVTFYNQAEYVDDALDSLLGQTYPTVEVIAVDDGSTDATAARCAAYRDRIVYVRQDNAGASAARNRGLEQARGSLVAHMDGDDLWEPDKLAEQVDAAARFPEAALIAVDGIEFTDNGIRPYPLIGPVAAPLFEGVDEPVVVATVYDLLLTGNFLATPSQVMYRADVVRALGGWDPNFVTSADYELYLRIAMRHPFAFVRQKLARWRYSPGGLSGQGYARGFTWELERQKILRAHEPIAPADRRPAIRRLRKEGTAGAARAAYHVAHKYGHRRWASGYLFALMATAGHYSAALLYLALVWCPTSLMRLVSGLRGRGRA